MKKYILLLAVVCFISAASKNHGTSFKWLEGVWEMKYANGTTRLEMWETTHKDLMSGLGLKIVGKDTMLLESLNLSFKDDAFWYIPTVPDQNNGQSIHFKLIDHNGNSYSFENPQHDFPQRIIYQLKPKHQRTGDQSMAGDTLYVKVESMEGDGFDYSFIKK